MNEVQVPILIDKLAELNEEIAEKKKKAMAEITELTKKQRKARQYTISRILETNNLSGKTHKYVYELVLKQRKPPINEDDLENILLAELVKTDSNKPKDLADKILKQLNKDRKVKETHQLVIKPI